MTDTLTIIRPMRDGKPVLSNEDRQAIQNHYRMFQDGDAIEMTIKKYKKTRSSNQRKYYFEVIVKTLCSELWGETHTNSMDNMNDHLKKNFNPEYYTTPEGREEVRGKSIEKEKTDKVEEIYSQIRMYAAREFNIKIPLPNEAGYDY